MHAGNRCCNARFLVAPGDGCTPQGASRSAVATTVIPDSQCSQSGGCVWIRGRSSGPKTSRSAGALTAAAAAIPEEQCRRVGSLRRRRVDSGNATPERTAWKRHNSASRGHPCPRRTASRRSARPWRACPPLRPDVCSRAYPEKPKLDVSGYRQECRLENGVGARGAMAKRCLPSKPALAPRYYRNDEKKEIVQSPTGVGGRMEATSSNRTGSPTKGPAQGHQRVAGPIRRRDVASGAREDRKSGIQIVLSGSIPSGGGLASDAGSWISNAEVFTLQCVPGTRIVASARRRCPNDLELVTELKASLADSKDCHSSSIVLYLVS